MELGRTEGMDMWKLRNDCSLPVLHAWRDLGKENVALRESRIALANLTHRTKQGGVKTTEVFGNRGHWNKVNEMVIVQLRNVQLWTDLDYLFDSRDCPRSWKLRTKINC